MPMVKRPTHLAPRATRVRVLTRLNGLEPRRTRGRARDQRRTSHCGRGCLRLSASRHPPGERTRSAGKAETREASKDTTTYRNPIIGTV